MSASSTASANFLDGTSRNNGKLQLDPVLLEEALGRREFGMRHELCQHELLTLDAIAELADQLPPAAVECQAARQPVLLPGGRAGDPVRPSEIVRNIDTNGRWMVLWNIEQSPRYRKLLDTLLNEVVPLLPTREGDMVFREAFLFLSSPGAVTPAHIDPEHNFLLQLRGRKEMCVGRFADATIRQHELDRYNDGGHRNVDAMPVPSTTFTMLPGDGVYIYPWAPHWVHNGPLASMSLSITFRTAHSQRIENAHRCNARLRKLGYAPRPVGESELIDWLKASYIATKGWLRRRGRPQRGAKDFS